MTELDRFADQKNHRIQVFTAERKFLRMFGSRGRERRELYQPISIAIDTSDRVYVGDLNHRISVFSTEDRFLTSFGRKAGEFEYQWMLVVWCMCVIVITIVLVSVYLHTLL